MSELFAAFRQHLVWSLMLWVLIFAAFTSWFAGGHLIAFAAGLWRVLVSIVTTPFAFIRRAVASVLGHSAADDARYRAGDQYLLNKGMLVLQAVVIIAAIGVLSAILVVTWNVLVPPAEVRRAAREYAGEVETQRKTSADAAAKVTQLDNEWAQKEQAVVAAFRKGRRSEIDSASKDMASIESSVNGYAGPNGVSTLQSVQETIASRSKDSIDDIHSTRRRIDSMVYNNWYWLGDWRATLERWNELWLTKAVAEHQLATLSVDALRAGEQPAYFEAKENRDREAERLASMEQRLAEHREAASLKWKAAFFRAVRAFVTFLLFAWFIGALIEGGWMALRIADDVRRIRQATPDVAAAVVPAEVRMPVRDRSPDHGVARPSAPVEA